jgi:hypothetical protein
MADSISSYLESARLASPQGVLRRWSSGTVVSVSATPLEGEAGTVASPVTDSFQVVLSDQGRQLAAEAFGQLQGNSDSDDAGTAGQEVGRVGGKTGEAGASKPAEQTEEAAESKKGASQKQGNGTELSEAEQAQVAELKARDTEVRAHEQAHVSAGGQYAGAAQLAYTTGPDGKRYAVSGEVSIDVSPIPDDPQGTVTKMGVVKRAALAPAEPSAADRMVYSAASRTEQNAQSQLLTQRMEKASGGSESAAPEESSTTETEKSSSDSEAFSMILGGNKQSEGTQSGSLLGVYA